MAGMAALEAQAETGPVVASAHLTSALSWGVMLAGVAMAEKAAEEEVVV